MAKTVNELTVLTTADSGDKIPIWDISAGVQKAITVTNLLGVALNVPSITARQSTVDVGQDLWIADPANPISNNFGLRVEDATFNGVRDTTYQLGFNRGAGREASKASIYLQWEDKYQYGPANSRSEFWLGTIGPSGIGSVYSRPWQVNLEHDSDVVNNGFTANAHSFFFRGAYSNTDAYSVVLAGNHVAVLGMGMTFGTNNRGISTFNAGGSAYPNVIKLNASNQVEVSAVNYNTYIRHTLEVGGATQINHAGSNGVYATVLDMGPAEHANTSFRNFITSAYSDMAASVGVKFKISNGGAGSTHNEVMIVRGDQRVGINDMTPDATLDISTPDATAVPVLLLEQLDVSEPFIKFVGASTTDNSQSLIDAANLSTPGAIVGWTKIYVEDVQGTGPIADGVYWVPFYATPTA